MITRLLMLGTMHRDKIDRNRVLTSRYVIFRSQKLFFRVQSGAEEAAALRRCASGSAVVGSNAFYQRLSTLYHLRLELQQN